MNSKVKRTMHDDAKRNTGAIHTRTGAPVGRRGVLAGLGLMLATSLLPADAAIAAGGVIIAGAGAGAVRPAAASAKASADLTPPIVFVPGNGDSAALWQTVIWRFEANGWPAARLRAMSLPYPSARDDDGKAQPGRSSTAEHMAWLSAEVDRTLAATGASQVILMGNSRGGNAIRNYLRSDQSRSGGKYKVGYAILGGTPNHGAFALPGYLEGMEFSGTGAFLTGLNAPKDGAGNEVAGPVRWMTVRSDANDKFAQPFVTAPDGRKVPSGVTYAGPELRGAHNVVIAGIDHRETSYSPAAFEAAYRFITGKAPRTLVLAPQGAIALSGKITGLGLTVDDPASGNYINNLPLAGAMLVVYAVDGGTGQGGAADAGTRLGPVRYAKRIGADGRWGPFQADAATAYEFEISAPGYATTHIYRSALPRSSTVLDMTPLRLDAADRAAGELVVFTRPRGYFDAARDQMSLDGKAVPGLPPAGAVLAEAKLKLDEPGQRGVVGVFNGETVAGRTWSAAQGQVTVLEVTQ